MQLPNFSTFDLTGVKVFYHAYFDLFDDIWRGLQQVENLCPGYCQFICNDSVYAEDL